MSSTEGASARPARRSAAQPPRRPSGARLAVLAALLVLPAWALVRLSAVAPGRVLAGGLALVSVVTVLLYWVDKRRAQSGGWRVPESTLHLAELAGGWPAAWLAQGVLRHKNAKTGYQIGFWLIVAVHQWLAADSLLGWRMIRAVAAALT